MMRRLVRSAALVSGLLAAYAASPAHAAPTLRYQVDQLGDFTIAGNTLGHDCGNGTPAPVVGTVGACGSNVSDSSPDVFWSADAPSEGAATASSAIPAVAARSTAVLELPAGAAVTYARLYWGAFGSTTVADDAATLARPGVFSSEIEADSWHTQPGGATVLYQSSALVTDLVQTYGAGPYRFAGADSLELPNFAESRAYAAWAMVVFYELAGQPLRQLSLFDGLDEATSGSGVVVDIAGFLVPNTGIDAKLGILAYGGDGQTGGDTFTFNGLLLTDGVAGGTNNFFNSSRTWLGAPQSTAGDLPQLTGDLRSMSGVDIDVVDVTTLVTPGSTSAQAVAKAGGDNNLLLGAWLTSITTYKPNFIETLKQATDVNGGALLVGDVVEYTIYVVNTGNDTALDVLLTDELPVGVSYVPGSLRITTGPNPGAKTDAVDGDQAEYDAGARMLTARLGTGADGTVGGSLAIDESTTVVFQVTIDGGTTGSSLANQATITARGENGAPTSEFHSDDGSNTGSPTTIVIDGCETNAQCSAPTAYCYEPPNPALPNQCVACLSNDHCPSWNPACDPISHTCQPCFDDSDCVDPTRPACQLSGACEECSATNALLCTGLNPICLVAEARCGCTDVDGDSECGAVDSGVICSGPTGTCVPGCAIAPNRNRCPDGQFCSEPDGDVGECSPQPCLTDDDCAQPQPYCDTSDDPYVCVQCLDTADCPPPLLCDTLNGMVCVECTATDTSNCSAQGDGAVCLPDRTCGCLVDGDCGAADSGRVCGGAAVCITGCRGTGGNGCPVGLVCTSLDSSIGACVVPDECQGDGDCPPERPLCDTTQSPKICVECIDAGDCGNENPVCGPTGECVGCSSDDDCHDPAAPACHTTGDLAGHCTECSATNDTLCDAAHPECFDELGFCACSDVDGDSECGAVDSGRVCDGPIGTCIDGCIIAIDRNGCPSAEYCTEQNGAIGSCLAHCMSDDDCTVAPELVCDQTAIPHVCVECLIDDECGAGTVCDVDARECVECTATKLENCTPDGNGAVCLADRTCGCAVDSDCGAIDSGRVCGSALVCIVGCRGTDGNGCPAGYHCTSTDAQIGTCEPDGGQGGAGGTGGGGAGGAGGATGGAGGGGEAGSGAQAGAGASGGSGGSGAEGGGTAGSGTAGNGAAGNGSGAGGAGGSGGDGTGATGATGQAGNAGSGAGQSGDDGAYGVGAAGGCGCSVPGSTRRSWASMAALAAGALSVARRRRRSAATVR